MYIKYIYIFPVAEHLELLHIYINKRENAASNCGWFLFRERHRIEATSI